MTDTLDLLSSDAELSSAALAKRVRRIRKSKGMTLTAVESGSGVTASTISKVENGAISPSYSTLIRLAKGLGIDIVELVSEIPQQSAKTRLSVTRFDEGPLHSIGTHDYRLLCTELTSKKMLPMLARIHAQSLHELKPRPERSGSGNDTLFSHEGEEVLFVYAGEVVLHTEHYAPVTLAAGDCAYIDSTMGHVCLRGSEDDALVFWVCSDDSGLSFQDR